MNDKIKSILAIMAMITTLSGIFLFWGIRLYQKNTNEKIEAARTKTDFLINEMIKDSNLIYNARLDALIRDEKILSAFYRRNRQELYQAALPFHNYYLAESHYYSNMHFHLPTGQSFLRMHKPDEFGDDLTTIRPIIMQIHKTRKPVSGYEIGKHGLFYRVAKPIFFKGEYIGALEIGISIEQVAENMESALNIKIARIINDKDLNDPFRDFRKNEIRIKDLFINPYNNTSLFRKLIHLYDFKRLPVQTVMIDGEHFVIFSSGNLKNFQGDSIARFVIAENISDEMKNYKSFLVKSISLTLILIVGAYIILHFSFSIYINKILELNRTLEKKVKTRTRDLEDVSEKLKATNAELHQIFNTAADGMRVIDKNFRIIRVNETFAKLIDQKKEQLKNELCHDHFKGKFCFTPDCTLARILNGENRIEIDVEKETASGEKRSFLLTATPFKSPEGKILGVVENFKDITHRKNAYKAIEEKEQYLNAIMSTVQSGVIITDDKSPFIIDANPYALKMIGCSRENLTEFSIRDILKLEKPWIEIIQGTERLSENESYTLTRLSGETLHIRLSIARATIRGRTYLVQSFSDITDVKQYIQKQMVDILKAKAIMDLVNPMPPGYTELPFNRRLFTEAISIPCNAEGGDHLFIRHFTGYPAPKTIISLKDQSGHEVNCILRSIYTDLIHNAILLNNPTAELETVVKKLNTVLCSSDFFAEDDFFTMATAQIDHDTLMMSYLTAGHPPLLLIRDNRVTLLPEPGQNSGHLPIPFLKDAQYTSTRFQLRESDQLILYTDGLTEMTIKHLKRTLSQDDLVAMTQAIIDDFKVKTGSSLPVSILMTRLLDHISMTSQETVTSEGNGLKSVNTSSDDVTLIGVEIGTLAESIEKSFSPENPAEISLFIKEIQSLIFRHEENTPFLHLKIRIAMILEEALTNAWKHGNRMNRDQSITLRLSFRNEFVFEIIDQGNGFDFYNLPDPTLEGNIESHSGRGIFIIHYFSDHVQWKGKGNHIIISLKKLKHLDDRLKKPRVLSGIDIWQKDSHI